MKIFHKLSVMGMIYILLVSCDSPAPKIPHIRHDVVSWNVLFTNKNTALTYSQKADLDAFIKSVPVNAVTFASISVNDSSLLSANRARSVGNYLINQGIAHSAIHLQSLVNINADKNIIHITVEYTKAVPPAPCPDWSKDPRANYYNTGFSNFGCAYNGDFIQQLANPEDYDTSHGRATISGTRDSVYIQNYTLGVPPVSGSTGGTGTSGAASTGR